MVSLDERILWNLKVARGDPLAFSREVYLRATERLANRGARMPVLTAKDYQRWIDHNEPTGPELAEQGRAQRQFSYRPLISLITPVFRPPIPVLIELVESVLAQSYDHFELCLGDFSNDADVDAVLKDYAASDPRIRVATFAENRGIAANSGLCFDFSQGEYLGLLDHDDTLSPNALFENVLALNDFKFDFAYSDRDKLDESGMRCEPFFKSGWSPDTLFSSNYVTHFNVFSRAVFLAVGGWNPDTDGAQDWDLFARITERSDRVVHIPKVLYHWRSSPTSAAKSMRSKPYAWDAQRTTVQRRIERASLDGGLVQRPDGSLRLDWSDVDLSGLHTIMLSTDGRRTARSLRHVERRFPTSRLHVLPRISALTGAPRGRSGIGIHDLLDDIARGGQPDQKVILVVADTIRFRRQQSLAPLLGWLSLPDIGAVGGRVLSRRGAIHDVGRVLHLTEQFGPIYRCGRGRVAGMYGSTQWYANVFAPAVDCFAFRLESGRAVATDADRGTESLLDLFIRLNQAGLRCLYTPDLVVRHTVRGAPPMDQLSASLPLPERDPYFNTNLSTGSLIPQLRLPS